MFRLVGGGQTEREVDARAATLPNVERVTWLDPPALCAAIAGAGACLGIFGTSAKASRVVPNKVYQCMAVGSAIITRDSPAARALLTDAEHALLVPPGDGAAIARAIRRLRDEPLLRVRLARGARQRFVERCTVDAIGRAMRAVLERAISRGPA